MKSQLLGQKRKMNNGMFATCIAFHSYRNIDVQFEDGTIATHKSGSSFISGKIANPALGKGYSLRRSIEGLTRVMNNGMKATCIAYRGSRDIDVQFEDGTVVTNKQKIHFLNGAIQNPHSTPESLPQRIIFEFVNRYFEGTKFNYRPDFMTSSLTGSRLEIDIWIPNFGIAIEYDGYPWHKKETKSTKEKARLFEQRAEVKRIYSFLEEGCVEHHGNKHINFFLGYTSSSSSDNTSQFIPVLQKYIVQLLQDLGIKAPVINLDQETIDNIRSSFTNSLIGKTLMMNNGMTATCIAYKRSDNIDIQFEDGTVVFGVGKQNFLAGTVANPTVGRGKTMMKEFVGISRIMNNGMIATIIRSGGYYDIDVQFEDGTIVRNTTKARFDKKNIANPVLGKNIAIHRRASVEGRTVRMNCGISATCLEDNGAANVTILFEDGTIVTHVARNNFLKGEVAHPQLGRHSKKKKESSILGLSRRMNNGLMATCIAYRSNRDIDIRFEDGTVVEHKQKKSFLDGLIGHPNESMQLTKKRRSSCVRTTRTMNNGMKATCIAYRGCADIDVQFEDGTIVRSKSKSNFLKGNIGYPRKP